MAREQRLSGLIELADISKAIKKIIPKKYTNDDVVFICIGTDRSTGDSLGPYIGTQLQKLGYINVFGTLIDPVHAGNLEENIKMLPTDKYVIAFDACLGKLESVGTCFVENKPLRPGAGVGKNLPEVGNCNIGGIVNVGGFMEYFVLQNTRLSLVVKIGDKIVEAINLRFPVIVDETSTIKQEKKTRSRKKKILELVENI